MLLAVDPGISACGCALFDGPALTQACLIRNRASVRATLSERVKCMAIAVADAHHGVQALAIECPFIYPQRRLQKGDQNDLILVALVVGALLSRLGVPSFSYYPRDWKRQMTKAVTRLRVVKRLSAAELGAMTLPAPSLAHNVYDGVGIGLHHLGRVLY